MKISRKRSHNISAAEARTRVERIAAKLAERFGARPRWDGDCLYVEHTGVRGALTLTDGCVQLEAELGFPVSLMRGPIEAEIDRLLEKELGA